jgi:hypothetical protein
MFSFYNNLLFLTSKRAIICPLNRIKPTTYIVNDVFEAIEKRFTTPGFGEPLDSGLPATLTGRNQNLLISKPSVLYF